MYKEMTFSKAEVTVTVDLFWNATLSMKKHDVMRNGQRYPKYDDYSSFLCYCFVKKLHFIS